MVIVKEHILKILESVPDPEIPVLTIEDLGIIRDVKVDNDTVTVVITPTYSGCPAMDMIEVNIKSALEDAGIKQVAVETVLTPAWTTDWISEDGKRKLREYGIAPPQGKADKRLLTGDFDDITCPHCGSTNTEMISQFGSTPCKSLFKCKDCLEPFDYFKCH
jgi:ring-1,2-phenylacetyl-CoA epoxidase subunit PaaD